MEKTVITMTVKSDIVAAKLIKMYIQFHPKCTSAQIQDHFINNEYGLMKDYTSTHIAGIIRKYVNYANFPNTQYSWFNVEIIRETGKPLKYKVKQ